MKRETEETTTTLYFLQVKSSIGGLSVPYLIIKKQVKLFSSFRNALQIYTCIESTGFYLVHFRMALLQDFSNALQIYIQFLRMNMDR